MTESSHAAQTFLEDAAVRLRAWQGHDVPVLSRLRNDEVLQARLISTARPSNHGRIESWLRAKSDDPKQLFFIVANPQSDQALGWLQYQGLDRLDRSFELGICLDPQALGRGYGPAAMRLAEGFLLRRFALRKLSIRVWADNQNAIRAFEKVGFAQVGCLRAEAWRDDRFHDVCLMEKLMKEGA